MTAADPRQNQLLAAMPRAEWARRLPQPEPADIPPGKVRHESGRKLSPVYFPARSIVSLLYVMELVMAQQLIANMLGVRRAGVTEAAGHLQHAGLISYSRGHIKVLDCESREQRSCECHAVVRKEYDRLLPATTTT